jgi:hypothetical protein
MSYATLMPAKSSNNTMVPEIAVGDKSYTRKSFCDPNLLSPFKTKTRLACLVDINIKREKTLAARAVHMPIQPGKSLVS